MKQFWRYLLWTVVVSAMAGWATAFHQHQRGLKAVEVAEAKLAIDALSSRESLIGMLATPEMQVHAAKQDASYQAWADGQISGFCFVHRAKMKRKWLPVRYGLPDLSELPSKEDARAFPFPDEGVFVGPCSGGHVREQEVHVCDECTHAYDGWLVEPRQKGSAYSEAVSPTAGESRL